MFTEHRRNFPPQSGTDYKASSVRLRSRLQQILLKDLRAAPIESIYIFSTSLPVRRPKPVTLSI
jgi:hypothetical protein